MEQAFDQIRRYIDKHRKPMLSLWEELVNTESGSLRARFCFCCCFSKIAIFVIVFLSLRFDICIILRQTEPVYLLSVDNSGK